ncbi:carbohydrate ABC transporter permease [Micromonospora peucetia]|uniref:Carbohydrate ABC transporter membrane protein 2, CUT1 family n=1 Tax=Micromonospora peucetia TaxID=47871 RepID=A0A1C6W2Z5_9ACTN|nr:carbohydrate ABC transporter permease [Micromonospora peucetia]MCX4391245.1 carbohydrate ABC transporter permease [Micromonospora peucetia]WSA32154.1 carbohydrate ABC transporter permease [Micromonospora peucetia]SCL72882.1 carbohydrate ABC transporter membrane protein 2, CUT1 family [Micromonospora peucetia]
MKKLRLGQIAVYVVLGLAAIPVLFPIYYGFVGAVMGPGDLATYPPALVPSALHWQNITDVFRSVPLGRFYANSAVQAGVITVAQVITSIFAAYAFAFLRLPAKAATFSLFLATLMVPWEAIIIPNYLAISDWGLTRGGLTYLGLVLPFLASAFGTFLLRQAFLQFPSELRDAAVIDGCGHWRLLWRVIVPLSKPSIAAVGVYVFLSAWNQYFWPLILIRDSEFQTLQIGISQLNDAEAAQPGLVLAGVALSLLPTLAVVIFGQRYIVRGLTAGALR